MPRSIATEQDIADIPTDNNYRLNFGRGLSLFCAKNGKKHWQFRMRINGEDIAQSLGIYDEVSLEEAKTESEKIRASLVTKRRQLSWQALKEKISNLPGKRVDYKSNCFRNMEDAREFFKILGNDQHHNSSTSNTRSLKDELRSAIQLQILIPAHWKEIIKIHRSDFSPILSSHRTWTANNKSRDQNPHKNRAHKTYPLAPKAKNIIEHHLDKNNASYLFPTLAQSKPLDLTTELDSFLFKLWPKYKINLTNFRDFFIKTAIEHSNFKEKFITTSATGLTRTLPHSNFVEFMALMEWWEAKISKDDFII